MIPTLIAAVAVMVVVSTLWQPWPTRQDKQRQRSITVTFNFTPSPRSGCPVAQGGALTDMVSTWVQIGSVIDPVVRLCEPASREYTAHVGQVVRTRMEQFAVGQLICSIKQPGHKVLTNRGAKLVRCEYTVV